MTPPKPDLWASAHRIFPNLKSHIREVHFVTLQSARTCSVLLVCSLNCLPMRDPIHGFTVPVYPALMRVDWSVFLWPFAVLLCFVEAPVFQAG